MFLGEHTVYFCIINFFLEIRKWMCKYQLFFMLLIDFFYGVEKNKLAIFTAMVS